MSHYSVQCGWFRLMWLILAFLLTNARLTTELQRKRLYFPATATIHPLLQSCNRGEYELIVHCGCHHQSTFAVKNHATTVNDGIFNKPYAVTG